MGTAADHAGTVQSLTTLDLELFDCIAEKLDVSKSNAEALFTRLLQLSVERNGAHVCGRVLCHATSRRVASGAYMGQACGSRHATAAAAQAQQLLLETRDEKAGMAIFDFCDQLGLWLEEPSCFKRGAVAMYAGSARRSVQRVVAQARASISAFKAELGPHRSTEAETPLAIEEKSTGLPPRPLLPSRLLPKLPWRSYSASRHSKAKAALILQT